MPDDPKLPRSKRSRYRAKAKPFSFIWKEGRIFEETTGRYLPHGPGSTVVGRGPEPGDLPGTLYFDADGRPATADTENGLRDQMCIYLFAVTGRLHPMVKPRPKSESVKDWNQTLASMGLEMDRGLQDFEAKRQRQSRDDWGSGIEASEQPGGAWDIEEDEWDEDDRASHEEKKRQDKWGFSDIPPARDEPRPSRSIFAIPRSAWRKALVSRLTVIFDREPDDPLIPRLADYLSRDKDWHEWWEDRSLDPLGKAIAGDNLRQRLILMLEAVAFQRGRVARSRDLLREKMKFVFEYEGQTYAFSVPRRHPRESEKHHQEALRALRVLHANKIAIQGFKRTEPAWLAAAVWKGARFLEQPEELVRPRPTCATAAKHFGLTPRQVKHVADKLLKNPCFWPPEVAELLNPRRGRPPKYAPRAGAQIPDKPLPPLNTVAQLPEAQPAMAILEEANRIEHGWRWSPDLHAEPPSRAAVRRARRLRKKGLDQLRQLRKRLAEPSD